MNAFIVELADRPGELAAVTEALAEQGIDITGFTGCTCGGTGAVCVMTNDEAATRRVLGEGGYAVRERELAVTTLAARPGSLAEAARKLADAGVNVEAAMPTGMSGDGVIVAFATDDPRRAREALGRGTMSGAGH